MFSGRASPSRSCRLWWRCGRFERFSAVGFGPIRFPVLRLVTDLSYGAQGMRCRCGPADYDGVACAWYQMSAVGFGPIGYVCYVRLRTYRCYARGRCPRGSLVDCSGLAWAMCCCQREASGLVDICSSMGYGPIVVLGTGVPVTVSLTI